LFEIKTNLVISYKSKSLSTCENWSFNHSLSTLLHFNSTPSHALGKPKMHSF
jgi:hypothetical protein